MIPALWAARFVPYKWLAVGLVMLAITAWGGIGWYGKRSAELALERERLAAARAVADQLAANQRLSEAQARRSAEIAAAYLKGKTDVTHAFQPALADLQLLRGLFAGGAGRVPVEPAPDGGGAMPGPADPAGGTHAVACTDRPGDLVAAAHRVAQDLAACAADLERLRGLQDWVREVQQGR